MGNKPENKLRLIFIFLTTMLLFPQAVFAQAIKLDPRQTQQQALQQTTTQRPTTSPVQPTPEVKPPVDISQTQSFKDLQNQLMSLEKQLKGREPWTAWFPLWWKISLASGLLWFLLWVFVGWQWSYFKFWGFGWPWPWWFWIPVLWVIPWFFIGWFWWPFWGLWWFWFWISWPWIFWPIWWIILFKEAMIWGWHRRK